MSRYTHDGFDSVVLQELVDEHGRHCNICGVDHDDVEYTLGVNHATGEFRVECVLCNSVIDRRELNAGAVSLITIQARAMYRAQGIEKFKLGKQMRVTKKSPAPPVLFEQPLPEVITRPTRFNDGFISLSLAFVGILALLFHNL